MAPLADFLRSLLALVLFVALSAPVAAAQSNLRLVEQDIKAGLIYNFLRYTQWPAPSRDGQPLVVCVYGPDPFSGRLQPMAGRTVNHRTISVRAVGAERELDACALVFINSANREDWPRLRTYLARRSILTVSDYDGFAVSGGMLEFTRVNNRIGVRMNVGAAEAANLRVEDRLRRLADVVRTERP
jgi:hypothetical protein